MTDQLSVVARAIALWVGYMGVLDTMPPGDPGDPRNDAWVEENFRPFLTAAKAAIDIHEAVLKAEGLVIVPREPNLLMLEAGASATKYGADHGFGDEWPEYACYQAMLAALEGKDD